MRIGGGTTKFNLCDASEAAAAKLETKHASSKTNSVEGLTLRGIGLWDKTILETCQIRFRRARFQTLNSVSFLYLTGFRGESSVSSFRSFIQNELTELFAEHIEFAAELSEFSLPKQ